VFLDDATITSLEKRMQKQGYLDAHEMGETFSMLRANDLIWSFVINNYLLGKEPLPFDLLYWNSDSTRMPAKMHSYYLRNMYQKNLLKVPGGISLKGAPIDLTKIDVPAYFLSTVEDHIAPWQSTYAGVHLLRGPVRFVLSGAGHTAGVVNPPSAKKYGHWIGSSLPDDPEEWLAGTTQMQESWWNDWQRWINAHGGKKVQSRKPGDGKLHPLEEAPGSFVKARIETGTK
jgi:polyhydroxyalkanoate synthase